jgi:hypothetical protein
MCDFLGTFAKLRKTAINFVMSVCPSIRLLGTTWLPLKDFYEIWFLSFFRKSVEKIPVSLKSDKNNCCFIWRPICILYHVSHSYFQNEKISGENFRENQNTLFMLNNLFFFLRKSCLLRNEMEKYCSPRHVTDDKIVSMFLSLHFPFTF